MRSRRRTVSSTKKIARWNRAKRSIPAWNQISGKQKRQLIAVTASGVATINSLLLTDIPYSMGPTSQTTRQFNTVRLKGFSINLHVRPDATSATPTFCRMAIIIHRDALTTPVGATEFFTGPTPLDQAVDLALANPGFMNKNQPINPAKYAVIWARTFSMGPHLEAGATSVQSNLNAQINVTAYCKYNKLIGFDTTTQNSPLSHNAHLIWWFDDVLRPAAGAQATTFNTSGEVKTFWAETA